MEKRISALTKALQDEDEGVRQAAARALEKIESRLEFDVLVKGFKEGDKVDKLRIIHAMADIEDARTIKVLLYSLQLPESELRSAALQALGCKANPKTVPYIIESIKDTDLAVQIEAIRALGQFKDNKVVDLLCELTTFAKGELMEAVIESLHLLKSPTAEDYLFNLVDDEDPRIRAKALEALGDLDPPVETVDKANSGE